MIWDYRGKNVELWTNAISPKFGFLIELLNSAYPLMTMFILQYQLFILSEMVVKYNKSYQLLIIPKENKLVKNFQIYLV